MGHSVIFRSWVGTGLSDRLVELADWGETVTDLLCRLSRDEEFRSLRSLFRDDRFVGVVVVDDRIVEHSALQVFALYGGEVVKVLRPYSGG